VKEIGDGVWSHSACLNLLGLVAEARGDWSKARRLWSRAARTDRRYLPPRLNIRRYFELFKFGYSRYAVAFGEESHLPVSL
jgi:hypothetical protein